MKYEKTYCIIIDVVTLIAMKREVAAWMMRVFRGANVKLENWRQVTVPIEHVHRSVGRQMETHENVDSCARLRKMETTCEVLEK